jgi:hypothetical protein
MVGDVPSGGRVPATREFGEALAVGLLVVGLGDHAADAAGPEVSADCARGVGLVGQHRVGARCDPSRPQCLAVAECWCARTIEEALARGAHMSVTKPIRNREAPVTEPQLK